MAEPHDETKPDSQQPAQAEDTLAAMSAEDLDALFSAALTPEPVYTPMEEDLPEVPLMDDALSYAADDAVLLTDENVEDILSGLDVDDELVPPSAAIDSPDTDALPVAPSEERTEIASIPVLPEEAADVSDDLIAALLSAAEVPPPKSEVVVENLAAAATAPGTVQQSAAPVISPSPAAEAAAIIEAAKTPPPTEPTAAAAEVTPKQPGYMKLWLRHYGTRLAASLVAGLLGAATTFTLLYTNQEHRPTFADLGVQQMIDLQEAYQRATALVQEERYTEAMAVLAKPMSIAPASELRTNAEFLMLECRFHTLNADIGSPLFVELHAAIDQLTSANAEHNRTPEALYWKARLYQRQELPHAAYDTLRGLAENHPTMANLDGVLLETAELGLELNRPVEASSVLQQLLASFPGSPFTGQARLLLADTYKLAGMLDDARTLYVRAAEGDASPQIRAEAILRLGALSLEGGDFAGAEASIEKYLQRTSDFAGNDAVYLQLAQVQRAMGKLAQARDTLTDLINFFPVSEVTPKAYVEITEVSDALGLREEAVQLAQRASVRFPSDPAVLRNKGIMLGLTGKPLAAAEAMLAAEAAGAFDPEMLLTAARHLRTAGRSDQAVQVYRKLRSEYGGLPAAIEGGIDLVKLQYELGNIREAITEIDNLELATAATPQHLSVLLAQAELYDALGWNQELGATARKIAAQASNDEDLAQAALGLLAAEDTAEARTLYGRIGLGNLREPTAYALQWKLGEQLLSASPREGMELMEAAWLAYPTQRTREDEKTMLRAYLAGNRPAAARRVVMELAMQARSQPIDSIHLLEAAIAWGDYLYARGDYRTAAEAYTMAEEAAQSMNVKPTAPGSDPRWAQFQRANALLQLRDYQGGLRLLDEIAASGAPWAKEAEAKANHTRLEQRLTAARTASG